MAVAAYASILSLLRVVDNIQHPSHLRFFLDPTQIDVLREKLCFLQDFLEVHSSTITEDIECMVRKIPGITYDAEILLNNYVVDQLYRELFPQNAVVGCNIDSIHDEIDQVIENIVAINEALKGMRATQHDQERPSTVLDKFTGNKPLKNKTVGFDDQLNQVLQKLNDNQKNLVMVPIVGMGGIGKTTLARSIFDHPYILDSFQVRIWLTISQEYSVRKILQGLLEDGVIGDSKGTESGYHSKDELITELHKKLFGQRYLIVLDDVWSAEAWDDFKQGIPDNRKGSRVMMTTRQADLANYLSHNNSYSMKLLDEGNSWDLLSERAFEHGSRTPELEEIGREISKGCKGLPLLLVVVGGLLANSNMSVRYWRTIADVVISFGSYANDDYCLRILSLSYNHLPIHLKTCFLFMIHFRDTEIKVSGMIKAWVSQGFVKPSRERNLEEAARTYLEDLAGRSMLLIQKRGNNGKIKSCSIHDLLWNVSINEFNKDQMLEVPRILLLPDDISEVCVICHEKKTDMTIFDSKVLGSRTDGKILVCASCKSTFPEIARSRFILADEVKSQKFPLLTTYRLIDLYYPHLYGGYDLSGFHALRVIWNLEVLDIEVYQVILPKEIWEMPQLRHVQVCGFTLPDPVSTNNDVPVQENLQTFFVIDQFKFTEEIVRRIQNIRKLGVRYRYDDFSTGGTEDWSCFYLQNLARLAMLETLYINCIWMALMDFNVIAFPCSLKKLTLDGCTIASEVLTIIGWLPNLEVLKLHCLNVLGKEWNPIEGEFQRLKYLQLYQSDIVSWVVNDTHFPLLETLFINDMRELKAIPREFGDLNFLNSVHLTYCKKRILYSAMAIAEQQLRNGNEDFEIHVNKVVD